MALYTVHVPPGEEPTADRADRVRFVKDGFAVGALLFAPLWLLWHRLWLGLLLWLLGVLALVAVDRLLGEDAGGAIAVLYAVWFALVARDLQRWTLERRGWRLAGVVEGVDRLAAERRFFETWTRPARAAGDEADDLPAAPSPAPAAPRGPAGVGRGPVIGLFPAPGGR